MKKKTAVHNVLILLAAVFLFFGGSIALASAVGADEILSGRIFSFAYALFLIFICSGLAAGLSKTLRKTVFSYTAAGLTGGILFCAALAVTVITELYISKGSSPAELFASFLKFPKRFSYFAVFFMVLVTLLVMVSNIALIRHEGKRLHNFLSVVFGAFYIGGTVALYFVSDLIERAFAPSNTPAAIVGVCVPLFLITMLCYFECIFVGISVLSFVAARKKPDYDRDYIIILGCSIDKRGGLLPLLKQRTNKAIRFAWDQEITTGKPVYYVPSGGQGKNEVISEGSAMELYLLSHGAEQNEIFPEKQSRNTEENMKFSKKIIDELNPDAKIAFATTNFHVFRSGIIARELGIDAQGIGSTTKWYFWPNGFIREFFGILAMTKKKHMFVALCVFTACVILGAAVYFGNI